MLITILIPIRVQHHWAQVFNSLSLLLQNLLTFNLSSFFLLQFQSYALPLQFRLQKMFSTSKHKSFQAYEIININSKVIEPVIMCFEDWESPFLSVRIENPELKSIIVKMWANFLKREKTTAPIMSSGLTCNLSRSSSISFFWRFNKAASVKI